MQLQFLDWFIIGFFFLAFALIGIYYAKESGKNAENFFLSGRNMPWWLLGVSMVATTFAVDTPNLVAGIVRQDGIAGNWVWWAFLLTGMLTVFFYARLWRRSGISTDIEFYELRYSGKSAAFLRGFRAVYLGFFFNIVMMANVCLAAIKIGHVLFGFSEFQVLLIASLVTLFYSVLGGLKGVLVADFIQFFMAMAGAVGAAIYVLNMDSVGGIEGLIAQENIADKLNFFPDWNNTDLVWAIFIIPLAVQWWSVWYPGAEPGGGGYIAQRMLAAKDEKNAMWATLLFNVAHYALRPWPWIIVGLASLIVFPDLSSLAAAFPELNSAFIQHDLAYPAMLSLLPSGLLGLVTASLIAAFMSTISTHLNWGSSYMVNDVYVRFVQPKASENQKVWLGRISAAVMMLLAALLSLVIEQARDFFDLLLQIGAGTGLLFILRWFWYRINPWSEITAMAVSFGVAVFFFLQKKMETPWFDLPQYKELLIGIAVTSLCWFVVTLLTKASKEEQLKAFDALIFSKEAKFSGIKFKIIGFLLATLGIYAFLFGTGYLLFGNSITALFLLITAFACGFILFRIRKFIF